MMPKIPNLPKIPSDQKFPVEDFTGFISDLTNFHSAMNSHKKDMAMIEAKKEIILKNLELKYDFLYKLFGEVFYERRLAINKTFEVIDKGIRENDRGLITSGLNNLSNIVVHNPIPSISELKEIVESGRTIDL